jgi:hypothetical protein
VALKQAVSTGGREMVPPSPLRGKETQEVVVVAVEGWFYQLELKHQDKKQGTGFSFICTILGEKC